MMAASRIAKAGQKIGRSAISTESRRHYNFASHRYSECFGNLPSPNVDEIRASALRYLDSEFKPNLWYDDPVVTLLNGVRLQNGVESDTVDAFGRVNGKIVHANPEEVDKIIHHVKTYRSPYFDLRPQIRSVEDELLADYVGFLIGNQALDFGKQDGVTEIEESIMANEVERRMNDILIGEELDDQIIDISRDIAFVGCVSNFSNFLDLFRKVLRNLELGVPCVVLSRSNTTQHTFRWAELLSHLIQQREIDPGMLTHASCQLNDIKKILAAKPDGPMYVTCSRSLAAAIKEGHGNTVASTGGPNTLFATHLTPKVSEAIRFSATIENSGQCTALRHAVLPSCSEDEVVKIFDDATVATSPTDALRSGDFAGIFGVAQNEVGIPETYTKHPSQQAYYRVGDKLPEDDIDEYWRRVVVDVTTDFNLGQLAKWLVRNQPISLAVNGDREIARALFEQTGLVVYTVGTLDNPALTCQARPQEGEVFGEFPVRRDLSRYTKFPVVVPSSTPSYNSTYNLDYLKSLDSSCLPGALSYIKELVDAVESKEVRGYCVEIANYLADAVGPKKALGGSRSVLWGLQRPPINGDMTTLRCSSGTASLDSLLPSLMPFLITNARGQVQVSIDPENAKLINALETLGNGRVNLLVEDDVSFAQRANPSTGESIYNLVYVDEVMNEFPLVGQFVSLFLSLGHIKSTEANDMDFIDYFIVSDKWLQIKNN